MVQFGSSQIVLVQEKDLAPPTLSAAGWTLGWCSTRLADLSLALPFFLHMLGLRCGIGKFEQMIVGQPCALSFYWGEQYLRSWLVLGRVMNCLSRTSPVYLM